ncbi:hypothetical protein Tco_0773979 [Tanacetum coccineum]|uniref:Reverse transcriptase domain-containing protein n=1 Tax=Tanacetum coccineum TaxID=301880 RepID=A0ABQ4ZRG9_9ASTR
MRASRLRHFEAFIWVKCEIAICWSEVGDSQLTGPELVRETTEMIVQIKNRLITARSRQKSYADVRRKPMEFQVGDMVMLKVSPWNRRNSLWETQEGNALFGFQDLCLRQELLEYMGVPRDNDVPTTFETHHGGIVYIRDLVVFDVTMSTSMGKYVYTIYLCMVYEDILLIKDLEDPKLEYYKFQDYENFKSHLQLWKCFGRLYFIVIVLDRNIHAMDGGKTRDQMGWVDPYEVMESTRAGERTSLRSMEASGPSADVEHRQPQEMLSLSHGSRMDWVRD